MDVNIRKAMESDVPAMLDLVKELAVFEREPDAVVVSDQEMKDAGFGKDPVWFGWVAEADSKIVGMALCYERYSTWKGRCTYLEDLVVSENARGQRIGEELFRACVEHARSKEHRLITWQVLDWNADAIRFYERHGAEIGGGWLNGVLMLQK